MTSEIKLRCINREQTETLRSLYEKQVKYPDSDCKFKSMIDCLQDNKQFTFISKDETRIFVTINLAGYIELFYREIVLGNIDIKSIFIDLEGEII